MKGESKNGHYFSFDKKFKIPKTDPKKNLIAPKKKIASKKTKIAIDSYEDKKIKKSDAKEVLKIAKKQNKPIKRLSKLGLETIKKNLLK